MKHISDENKQIQFNYLQSIKQILYAEYKLLKNSKLKLCHSLQV